MIRKLLVAGAIFFGGIAAAWGQAATPVVVVNGASGPVTSSNPLAVTCISGCSGGGGGGTSSNFGAAFPAAGTAVGMSQGGNMVAMTGTAGNLNVQCANCSGSGASAVDEAAYTAGTSVLAPAGGFFQTTATTGPLTTGQQGMVQMTATRAFFVNPRNSAGTEIGNATTPFQVSLANTAANATAVLVTGTGGTFPATQSTSPWIVAGGGTAGAAATGVVTVQGIASMTALLVNPSTPASWAVGATAGAVPANASYTGLNNGGNQIGWIGDASGRGIVAGAGTAGTATGGVLTVQGVASMTPVQVSQATASNLNALVSGTGSAGTAATGVVTVQGIASMTPVQVSQATAASLNATVVQATAASLNATVVQATAASLNATVSPVTAATWGVGATSSAAPANASYSGGVARSAEPTAATTGNLFGTLLDLVGKTVTSPYANRELMVRGTATTNGTGATTILAASGSASVKTYVTDLECFRNDTNTTAITLTLSDAQATVIVLPNNGGGGGVVKTFNVPLVTAANAAFTFTSGTSITSVTCNAQGFSGY